MIKLRRALAAGIVGSLTTVLLAVGIWWLLRFDASTHAAMVRGNMAVLPGFVWILLGIAAIVGGAAIAVGYAFGFEFVTRRAGWWIGAAFGAAHGAAVWLGIGLLCWWQPAIAEFFADELSLLFNNLMVIVGFAGVHVAFGAIVGALYGPPRHRADADTLVTWRELIPTTKHVEVE